MAVISVTCIYVFLFDLYSYHQLIVCLLDTGEVLWADVGHVSYTANTGARASRGPVKPAVRYVAGARTHSFRKNSFTFDDVGTVVITVLPDVDRNGMVAPAIPGMLANHLTCLWCRVYWSVLFVACRFHSEWSPTFPCLCGPYPVLHRLLWHCVLSLPTV